MTSLETVNTARRVLVVDDVMLNRRLVIAFLSRLGWQTFESDGGLAALDWLESNPPVDVLLLDISMPDLCGESVCRQLRSNPAFDDLKIVAYTAHAGADDSQRFLANGFNAVLIKPISSQRLKDLMTELLGV